MTDSQVDVEMDAGSSDIEMDVDLQGPDPIHKRNQLLPIDKIKWNKMACENSIYVKVEADDEELIKELDITNPANQFFYVKALTIGPTKSNESTKIKNTNNPSIIYSYFIPTSFTRLKIRDTISPPEKRPEFPTTAPHHRITA